MTSKEALERLLMLARPCAYEVREHRNSYCDMLENAILQDLERLEELEEDLKYLANQEIQQFVFPNGRTILGVDITSMPSEKEKIKRMIERILKEVLDDEK